MRSWAWVSLMVWVGLILAVELVRYFYGEPDYVRMFFSVLVLFALNQAEAQEAFGIHRRGEDSGLEQPS